MTAAVANGEVFTTGSWYYRLGRAVTAGTGTGALSGRFQALDDSVRQRVMASLEDLPDQIGLLSLRVVVPVMQAVAVTRPLNFLNAEALGAALLLDASIVVTVDAPLLRAGASDLSVSYRMIDARAHDGDAPANPDNERESLAELIAVPRGRRLRRWRMAWRGSRP